MLKSTLLRLFCVFALLTGLASSAAGQTVVNFPDPNLEAAIRAAIGKPTGPIYDTDVAGLRSLLADGVAISDLTGLEHCTSLISLSLSTNQISDLSPLAGLTSLIYLYLRTNQINDLGPLAGLTSLTTLYLHNNQISDLSALAGLTNLTELYLNYNQIR